MQSSEYNIIAVEMLDERLFGYLEQNLELFDQNMVIGDTSKACLDYSLPLEYKIKSLSENHVPTIAENWLKDKIQAERNSLFYEMVKDNIQSRPSLGVFYKDKLDPVAWVTLYITGMIAQLNVLNAHQHKSLARTLVRVISKKVKKIAGVLPATCIHKTNKPSLNLFISEGFKLQPQNYQAIFLSVLKRNLQ